MLLAGKSGAALCIYLAVFHYSTIVMKYYLAQVKQFSQVTASRLLFCFCNSIQTGFFSHSIKHTQMLRTWESCSPRHLLLRSGKLSCFFWLWFLRLGNVACGSKMENTTAYPPMLTVWGNRLQLSVNRKVALSRLYSHANCFTWVFQQYDALNPIWDIRPGVHCRW